MRLFKRLNDYFEDNLTAPISHIYHYTKPALGKKIIDNGVLRLSSCDELNKKNNREFIRGSEIIKEKLKITSISEYSAFFEKWYLKDYQVYIASFCEENNNKHAIETYGTFCLGFKDSYLQRFKSPESSMILGHVIYNKKTQERIISEMIELHEEHDYYERKLNDLLLFLHLVIPFLKEERDYKDNECGIVTAQMMSPHDPTKVLG